MHGEQLAADFLKNKGYQIVIANWRCKIGEIDIIAQMNHTLVFVEVKTRKSIRYGFPVEAVDWRKQFKLRKLAEWYLNEYPHIQKMKIRFDVISVFFAGTSDTPRFEHYEGAF